MIVYIFRNFVNNTPKNEKTKVSFSLGKFEDKEKRTSIHNSIKLLSGVRTETKDGEIVVEFTAKKSRTRSRDDWPSDTPPYLNFVLQKTNWDTTKCISEFAQRYVFRIEGLFIKVILY